LEVDYAFAAVGIAPHSSVLETLEVGFVEVVHEPVPVGVVVPERDQWVAVGSDVVAHLFELETLAVDCVVA